MSTSNKCPVKKTSLPVSTKPKLTATSTSSLIISASSLSSSLPESVEPRLTIPSSSTVSSFLIKDILNELPRSPQPPRHHHHKLHRNQTTLESDEENELSEHDETKRKGKTKVRSKPRIAASLTDHQLSTLEICFEYCKYPDAQDVKDLAEELDLSQYKVRTWYQHRRTKQEQSTVGREMMAEASNYTTVRRMIERNPNRINPKANILPKHTTPYDMYNYQSAFYPPNIYPNLYSSLVPPSQATFLP